MLIIETGAHSVRIAELVGGIRLPPDGRVILERILSDAVVKQIPDPIRREMQARVAGGQRGLPVERAFGVLPAHDRVLRELVLRLVQIIAQKGGLTVDVQAQRGLQTQLIRNLELIVRDAHDQRKAVVGIDDVLEIAEAVDLGRVIMKRIGAAVGRFDAEIILLVVAGYIVGVFAVAAAVFGGRLKGRMAAAVDRHLAAGL